MTYGEMVERLREMVGHPVLAQMRSSAGGDHLTVTGTLVKVEMFADQAVKFEVGEGRIILHFSEIADRFGFDEGVMVRYEDGGVFRCVLDDHAE